jgi:hypothetical protein
VYISHLFQASLQNVDFRLTGFPDYCERKVFFQEELSRGIEGNTVCSKALLYIFRLLDNQRHGFVPCRSFQLASFFVSDLLDVQYPVLAAMFLWK